MTLLLGALAVYKMVQLIESVLPKDPMPWVKILGAVLLSFVVTFVTSLANPFVAAFAMATIAGAVHTVLRTLTFIGDRYRIH